MLRRAALALLARRAGGSGAGAEGCWACLARQVQPDPPSSSADSRPAWRREAARGFTASPLPAAEDGDADEALPASARVQQLAEEIMHLNLLEVADLTDILQKRLNIPAPSFGGMPMMGAPFPAAAGGGAPAAEAAAAATAPEEKTEFDVRLTGFDAAAKIKVIKEVRGVTELGLKEAKELVEKAPVVVKAGLKKEEAEELRKKLEAVGAKVAVE